MTTAAPYRDETRENPARPLAGQVVLVTGAGRGIGRALALAFADAGAAVGLGARSLDELERTADEIEARGGQSLAIQADVTDPAQIRHQVEQVADRFGGLDMVVINAGISPPPEAVADSDPVAWRETLDVNLLGAYHTARAAIPHLIRRGAGKIITVGSGLGHRGRADSSAYACSKAALWMFTRVLAQELWPYHISVNELVPGPVQTGIGGGGSGRFGDSEWIKTPEDVVPLALFLATQPRVGPTAQSFSLLRRDA